jgi:polyphosphate kinase
VGKMMCIKREGSMAKGQNSDEKPKLKRKQYEKELHRLQAELCKLQEWVKFKGLRIIVVF